MNRLNPDKFLKEIESSIFLIDEDMSKEGTTSNIIDRAARSILSLLKLNVENATEPVVTDEIKKLKEQTLRLEVEVARLNRLQRLIK